MWLCLLILVKIFMKYDIKFNIWWENLCSLINSEGIICNQKIKWYEIIF